MFAVSLLATLLPLAWAGNICRDHGMKHGFFSMNADGSDLRLVRMVDAKVAYDKVRPSPDGKSIVFLECVDDLDDNCLCDEAEYKAKQVVLSGMDGADRRLISEPKGGFNDYPNWSPDGRSVIFMHSSSASAAAPDLYRFELKSGRLAKLTDTPTMMESDNHWNDNGLITVVAQPWRGGKPGIGNVYEFPASRPAETRPLTGFAKDLGRHCCAADPKYSPDGSRLVYSRKVADDGEDGRWEIVLREKDGSEKVLNSGEARGYWPMWSRDGAKLFWVTYDGTYAVAVLELKTGRSRAVPLVGEGVTLKVGGKELLLGAVGWPSWLGDRVFFPATYLDVTP